MLPLYDMMMKANGGRFAELLARQANLSRQQAELALESVLPAFSEALKRNASDPFGMSRFLNTMASGQYARYFDDAGRAFAPDGLEAGNEILSRLFGSSELTKAISEQAAQATGLAQDTYRQMMPAIASMMMGGFFKQATGQMGGVGPNPFLDAFQKMMPQKDAAPDPFANPYAKMMQDMFAPGAKQGNTPDPLAANPFFKAYQDWMEAVQPKPEAAKTTKSPSTPFDAFFEDMFETGKRQRAEYDEAMRKMVGEFLSRPA